MDKNSSGPLVLKKKITLTKDKIKTTATSEKHDCRLDCILCKTVMLTPRECGECRKGFCKACVEDYIRQMIEGDYVVCCPNCGNENFQVKEPHPLLTKALTKIMASCENSEQGCTATVSYNDLALHQEECDYATVKCTHYGCDLEMLQKDFATHESSCEFRVTRCAKCDVV